MKKLISMLTLAVLVLAMPFAMAEEAIDPAQLMEDVAGTYVPLFSVLNLPEYDDLWVDYSADLVGEEDAQAVADMLRASTTAEIYGEEAVEAYAADPDSMRFDCYFTEGVDKFVFDGNTVTGLYADGNEVFSHSYTYVQELPEAISCYAYKTDDADAGEFTYICLAPDTPDTTFHIEFRYGDDLEALGQMYEGKYAFWQAAGMLEDADDEMIENCIELFCTENASEE